MWFERRKFVGERVNGTTESDSLCGEKVRVWVCVGGCVCVVETRIAHTESKEKRGQAGRWRSERASKLKACLKEKQRAFENDEFFVF